MEVPSSSVDSGRTSPSPAAGIKKFFESAASAFKPVSASPGKAPSAPVSSADDPNDLAAERERIAYYKECLAQAQREDAAQQARMQALQSKLQAAEAEAAQHRAAAEQWRRECFATLPSPTAVTDSAQYKALAARLADEHAQRLLADTRAQQTAAAVEESERKTAELQTRLLAAEEDKLNAVAQVEAAAVRQQEEAAAASAKAAEEIALFRALLETERAHRKELEQALQEARNSQQALQLEVESLRSKNAQLTESVETQVDKNVLVGLQHDRDMLIRELNSVKRDFEALQQQQKQQQAQQKQQQDKRASSSSVVARAPSSGSNALTSSEKKIAPAAAADTFLHQRFQIPTNERQVAMFQCYLGNEYGCLYITQNYLLFGPTNPKTANVILSVKDVISLDKTGTLNKTHCIVRMRNSTTWELSGLKERKRLCQIVDEMKEHATGKHVDVLRNGAEDPNSGILKEDDFVLVDEKE